ncbi:MAG: hypothetical protein U1F52_09625 [Burkholderiales bacterium]
MLLRIALIAIAVFFVISLLERTFSPQAVRRAELRKQAWRIAVRKTAFTLGACGFAAAAAFGGWHALRTADHGAALLAMIAFPLAALLGFLAYRTGRV